MALRYLLEGVRSVERCLCVTLSGLRLLASRRGSSVTVRPPARATPSDRDPADQTESNGARDPLKAPVIDENVDAADCLLALLEEEGHEILIAYDALGCSPTLRIPRPVSSR